MTVRMNLKGQTVVIENGDDRSVLELARQAGWHIDARCGGHGSCGACNVLLAEGRYRLFGETIELAPEQRREVLACQTEVVGDDAEIFIPRAAVIAFEGARIADEMEIPAHTFNPRFKHGYGIAVDIGTTTVVAGLIELETGHVLHRESLYNQQILKADDVIARIALCREQAQLKALQELVIEHTLNPLIHKLCIQAGIHAHDIVHIALSGNTVMMHLAFGVSPEPIGVMPYEPASRTFESSAVRLGIDAHTTAIVEAVPAISGYVGGDIVSDLIVRPLDAQPGLHLLIDIGTNGEMVARHNGSMTACATAAGPAFEGAGLLHGMRAASRAIDTIRISDDHDIEYTTIGDPVPMGLCGSAIIDFIAEGFRTGLINWMGRYDIDLLKKMDRHATIGGMHACILVPAAETATGEAITITEHDIAEILKAKAAIYAGLKTLLAELGKTVHQIDRLILAGGFAKHIKLENAIAIGLLPDLALDRYEIIGNGSLAGAALTLLDQETHQAALDLIDRPRVLKLNQTAHFTNYYQEALALPNLDESDFPNQHP